MPDYSNDFQISYNAERTACSIRFRCFDTPNSVTVYGCGCPDANVENLLIALRRECLEYHRLWSFTRPGSDIARINDASAQRVRVDARTADILHAMQRFHEVEPSFDFTIGPVSYLWKHATEIPSETQIEQALGHVGASKVRIQDDEVIKDDPLVQVDVGGAAKGFVADALANALRAAGIESADVDLGGNLYMLGQHPAGRPWRVSVRIPEGVNANPIVLEVSDQSVVTSGSYERFVQIDGKRYQHIIDARTGWPAESDIVSATVVANSSLQADLLATTALLEGSNGIAALEARHPEAHIIALTTDGVIEND